MIYFWLVGWLVSFFVVRVWDARTKWVEEFLNDNCYFQNDAVAAIWLSAAATLVWPILLMAGAGVLPFYMLHVAAERLGKTEKKDE